MMKYLRSKIDIEGQFEISTQTIARVLILSYFVGLSVGLIGGTDLTILATPFLEPLHARLVMALLVVVLCVIALVGVHRRTAVLTLAIILFWSSYMTMFRTAAADVDFFWRDLALIGGLLFSAGFGDTSSKEPEIDEVQEGDDGIVKISRSTSSYNDPNQAQSRPRPISARQVRKDLDLARVG